MSNRYNLILERDLNSKSVFKLSKLPSIVDLRNKISTIYDQDELPCSTANALSSVFRFNNPSINPSRLFLYYNERKLTLNNKLDETDKRSETSETNKINKKIEPVINKTNKTETIIDSTNCILTKCILACKKYGVCSDESWPYDINKLTKMPNASLYDQAMHNVIEFTCIPSNITSIKSFIYKNEPLVVGISIYESFESDIVTKTGNVPLPDINTEKLLGAHACVCVGYNDVKNHWIMLNSFGENWGDNGYFYLPYSYLLNDKLSGDIWNIKIKYISNIVKKIDRTPLQLQMLKTRLGKANEKTKQLKNYKQTYGTTIPPLRMPSIIRKTMLLPLNKKIPLSNKKIIVKINNISSNVLSHSTKMRINQGKYTKKYK